MLKNNTCQRRKDLGICITCGKNNAVTGKIKCQKCLDMMKEKRRLRIQNGLCGYCGKPAIDGKTMCIGCQSKQLAYGKRMKEQGLCLLCAKPTKNGMCRCEECSEKDNKLYADRKRRGVCPSCSNSEREPPAAPGSILCVECQSKQRDRTLSLKREVMEAYGGKCQCCGESEIAFLSIDHINNDGYKHRSEIGVGGTIIYSFLKKKGFPKEGFQVLCFNCNHGKHINGGVCPHKDHR